MVKIADENEIIGWRWIKVRSYGNCLIQSLGNTPTQYRVQPALTMTSLDSPQNLKPLGKFNRPISCPFRLGIIGSILDEVWYPLNDAI